MPELTATPEALRLAAFVAVFVVMAIAEIIRPRRQLLVSKKKRWVGNLTIVAVNTLLVRLIVPVMPYQMALAARDSGWGLFNLAHLSGIPELAASLLLLDVVIYAQHRLFHRIALFWRFHRMHHTDLDLDVSSGTRFHPLEMLVSIAIKLAAVAFLGASPLAVLLFEILLNATSMFNHANVALPPAIDRWLRLALVTPDMHRVHHSTLPQETDSNFGFNQPWWDRLFGTYRAEPRAGHARMTIGLQEFRNLDELGIKQLLLIPFAGVTGRNTP